MKKPFFETCARGTVDLGNQEDKGSNQEKIWKLPFLRFFFAILQFFPIFDFLYCGPQFVPYQSTCTQCLFREYDKVKIVTAPPKFLIKIYHSFWEHSFIEYYSMWRVWNSSVKEKVFAIKVQFLSLLLKQRPGNRIL